MGTTRLLFTVALAICSAACTIDFGSSLDPTERFRGTSSAVDSYTYELEIFPGAASQGPTAPSWAHTASEEYAGLAFDNDSETVHFSFKVPACWNGSSDITLEVYWSNESGAALSNTETVKWDTSWRTKAEGEDLDSGSATTATATYTQSGAGTDGELFVTDITIDYDASGNVIAAGDLIAFHFDRDMTGDTYASDAVVIAWHFDMTANKICTR